MSNSKKNWNASKALKRSIDANKKNVKIAVSGKKIAQKKNTKVVKQPTMNGWFLK